MGHSFKLPSTTIEEPIINAKGMNIDKAKFYAEYRKQFGAIQQPTVDTLEAIIDVFNTEAAPTPKAAEKCAYMLATVRHEVGAAMVPIIENMCYTEARIRQVWPSRPEAVKFGSNSKIGKKCDPVGLGNSVYANRLGNGPPSSGDGYKYRGRGIGAQFTGRVNYEKFSKLFGVDFINNPDLAMDRVLGAKILFKGSIEGLFTGVSLGNYLNATKTDYVNARRVINADVARNGGRIAADAVKFEKIIKAAI